MVLGLCINSTFCTRYPAATRPHLTARISGGGSLEDHGLFGSISATPIMLITSSTASGNSVTINWAGGVPPYVVQQKTRLSDATWTDVQTSQTTSATLSRTNATGFFRIKN